ncbi:MAG: PDZ domain-containing protein [Desulfobacterales bacterium]|nr:PDZ domain-containing protein [Desulfobacterales bacterium]
MKRYFIITDIFFITAIVFFSVKFFYKIITISLDPIYLSNIPNKPVVYIKDDAARPFNYYKVIVDRNIFKTKTKEQQTAAKQIDVEALKQTELKLKLWGTVTGDAENAYAIIEDSKDKQQNIYRMGDSIQNAVVKMIIRGKVVLLVDGKDEILEMDDESIKAAAGQNKKTTSSSESEPYKNTSNEPEVLAENTISRSQLTELMKDSNLMQQAKITPNYVNGKPEGLILTNINPSSLFRKVGLKNRDIISGINGKPITSLEEAAKLYENLATSSNMSLQIMRRGEQKTLELKIE